MKIFELEAEETRSTAPVVYVDMDGVLADMWGAVARHHGVDHWRKARKIPNRSVDQIAKKKGFFLRLRPLSNAGKLIHGILKNAGKYSILSSPLMSEVEQSSREKSEWLEHHLPKNSPTSVIFDHNKEKFARQSNGQPNILIDDYATNIRLWQSRGGIGILYKNDEIDRVLKELHAALRGLKQTRVRPMEQATIEEDVEDRLYTNREVLKYVKGIHHEYHLEKPILAHKVWQLKHVPIASLNTPERYDQDDPYRRVIDIDWDHVDNITASDINSKPVVADEDGWLLDGNHRAVAARARGMKSILAFVPYESK